MMALISFEPESEPFPFFDLPELVIRKILKEYVPVSDKMCVLSQIPEFKPYLQQKSLWFEPTLKLFQLTSSIKSGWYIVYDKLPIFHYFLVDYFDLSVTMHIFHVEDRNNRIAVQYKKWPRKGLFCLEQLIIFLNYPFVNFVKENEVLVYSYEDSIYFWIFKPTKIVHWSRDCQFYQLINNTCSMLDNNDKFILTLRDDFSVVLQSYILRNGILKYFVTVLLPLTFQPCAEKRPYELDNKPWECKSCKKGPNYAHTNFKMTYVGIDKDNILKVTTLFYENEESVQKYVADWT